ncbi:MAG: signal transduction histidine kinase/DNA-binding NarL/FixJ family response regulator [Cryomorphaceae bacterium]|jgi:signal transduction histidine kinase/DNA-binding NarL/FixJ family response regulator/HPt (histidine-containing phosphotransfer) domain-containing protein
MEEDTQRQLALAKSRARRHKAARAEAEYLLEEKSRELFNAKKLLERAQKRLENEVKQATYELGITNARLHESLGQRSSFIGQMSHEVRTPLNAIIGLSEILQSTPLNELQADYIQTIGSGAKSLVVLLNDLLDITKIEAGRVELRNAAVQTQPMHKNIIAMFAQRAEKQGIKLNLRINPSVPKRINIDEGRYKQIINNLLTNALKNTAKGGVMVDVKYQKDVISKNIGMLKVKIIDTGVGIQDDQINRIFDAYEQVGIPDLGVGLGLAISQQLCELMMGKISCQSKVGLGSVFLLEIPAERLDSLDVRSDLEAPVELVPLPELRILVAEDTPTNQKVLTAQLSQLGQKADIVNNGAEAIERLKQKEYDAVILDILMPVMDGEETLKAIRSSEPKIASHYCIALTASNFKDQRKRLLKLGFDAFLSKPLSLVELSQALSKVPQQIWGVIPGFASDANHETHSTSLEEPNVFDFDFLKTQFGDAYRSIFLQIAPIFLDNAYADFELLIQSVEQNHTDKIKKISHSMKGAASSLGLTSMANVLLQIEGRPDAAYLSERMEELTQLMSDLKPAIQEELAKRL